MPIYIENEARLKIIIAAITGFIFFSGWWIFIDIAATYQNAIKNNKICCLPGLVGTAAMFIVNSTPYKHSRDYILYDAGLCNPVCSIIILFMALTVSFGMFIWALYIGIQEFFIELNLVWPGVGIIIQNFCILSTNLVLKFNKEMIDTYP